MDAGKQEIFLDRRREAAKEVIIVFPTQNTNDFNVIDKDGNLKYHGFVTDQELSKFDYCTCPSFEKNETETYRSQNAFPFQCKHILAARSDQEIRKK
jgi:hypothetical protein